MMTTELISENFRRHPRDDGVRWVFEPKHQSILGGYRYVLTFVMKERRFVLSRQRIERFETVDDVEQTAEFRSLLTGAAIADLMRKALLEPADDDDGIPF